MRASSDFALRAPNGGREDLHVSPASKLWFVVGWVGIGAGGGAAAFAVSVILGGALLSFASGAQEPIPIAPLLAVAGGGGLIALGGWALMHAHRTTTVSQDPSPPGAATRVDTPTSVATWRDSTTTLPLRASTLVPIFTARF